MDASALFLTVVALVPLVLLALLPAALGDWYSRAQHRVTCPHAGLAARVAVTQAAAPSARHGLDAMHVVNCSFWPARRRCDQACAEAISDRSPADA